MEILKFGASFHDIGKIGIEDRILMKATELDADEWQKMRLHTEIGESILLATGLEGSKQAARIIRHHHEHRVAAIAIADAVLVDLASAFAALLVYGKSHRPGRRPSSSAD